MQTYSSGEEVAWIEAAADGAAEPERPAPTLQLVPAAGADEAAAATADDGDDGTDTLSIVALVVGALGLVAGIAALVVARRRPAT